MKKRGSLVHTYTHMFTYKSICRVHTPAYTSRSRCSVLKCHRGSNGRCFQVPHSGPPPHVKNETSKQSLTTPPRPCPLATNTIPLAANPPWHMSYPSRVNTAVEKLKMEGGKTEVEMETWRQRQSSHCRYTERQGWLLWGNLSANLDISPALGQDHRCESGRLATGRRANTSLRRKSGEGKEGRRRWGQASWYYSLVAFNGKKTKSCSFFLSSKGNRISHCKNIKFYQAYLV